MSQLTIVLLVTLFMMIMFIWHKVPFGVTTMLCCLILAAAGVVELNKAFTGFGNKTVVLIAPTLALSAALTKTELVGKISGWLNGLKGKNGMLLILAFFGIAAIFSQFVPSTAALAILVVFLTTLDDAGEITAKRLILPLLGVMVAWKFRLPVGLGASTFATLNGFYEGILSDPAFQIQLLDPFRFAVIPIVVLTLYCVFCWRLMPREADNRVDTSKLKHREAELLPRNKQTLVYIIFCLVMLAMIFNKYTGQWLYLAPALGVILLIMTGCLTAQQASKEMSCDMIWMLAGVLVVADAIGQSGAADVIGNFILRLIGENPSSFKVMLIFSAATVIMTTFISNMGTQSVLIPIAASVALAAGWDPRGLVLIIGTANYFAVGFPSGSGECAVAFAAGGYNPAKVLRFTLPYMLLAMLSCAVSAQLLYPLT